MTAEGGPQFPRGRGTHSVRLITLDCLRQEVHIPRLITPAEKGRDLEPRVIDAYIIQCQAEAQEGKVAPGLNTERATVKLYKL